MSRTPIHPGEILSDELETIGVNTAELAREIQVPASRIAEIIKGRRSITADTALRLGKWFGMSPQFWLNLQKSYELRMAEIRIGRDLNKIKIYAPIPHAAAAATHRGRTGPFRRR